MLVLGSAIPKSEHGTWRLNMMDPTGKHLGPIDMYGATFSKTSQRAGRFHHPLYFTSAPSSDFSEMRRIICNRRIPLDSLYSIPPSDPRLLLDGRLHLFWEGVSRNYDRACCRMLSSELAQGDMNMGPLTAEWRYSACSPAGEEYPVFPAGTLALRLPFGCFMSSSVSEKMALRFPDP